jgi:hypothetical protein
MKDFMMDVDLEIPNADILSMGDSVSASKEIINRLRIKAEQVCREAGPGVQLRTDHAPEIVTKQAMSPILGGEFFLVGSRWACTVPDNFDPANQSAR